MLEMKITIAAPDLAAAINSLAAAMSGKNPHTVCNQYGENNHQIDNVGTFNMGVENTPAIEKEKLTSPAPTPNTQPTAAPAAVPPTANPTMPVPGVPLSATPAQTATPVAHTVPVAQPAPAVTPAANPVPAPIPTSAPQYTLDMIATAGSALIDAGKMDQLMGLLAKFGVASLTELSPNSYGAVASELRALGAAI